MYNEYYPENTNSDCFENFGGRHIDDRMKVRGNSYSTRRTVDDKPCYATREMLDEKKHELQSLLMDYNRLYASVYNENSSERMVGEDLAMALKPLESLWAKIESIKHFIAKAQVVSNDNEVRETVGMFSKVTVKIQGTDTRMTLRIVGENDANSEKREVSCVSPVGKALLGKSAGETVDIQVEGRIIHYVIESL